MSRFSRSEAEANGWVIVHEDEGQGLYRAEKYIGGNKIEQSGITEGLLLEAINAYEDHLASSVEPVAARVDESNMPLDEDGNLVRSVLGPDDMAMTEAEWANRGVHDAVVREDGEMRLEGATPAAAEADEAREEIAREKENERTAEPDVGPTEALDLDNRDHQLAERLIVREGEDSMPEVIDRKLEESADAEAERSNAGIGIGPMDLDAEGNLVPPGGRSEIFDPRELPGGVDSGEEVVQARAEAEIEEATALRDEHGKAADKPELAGEVAEAGSEAQQDLADEKAEDSAEPSSSGGEASADQESLDSGGESQPEATEAALELAEEENVDLSQVKGSGKDGKIVKSDVEAAAEGEGDPED